MSVLCEIGTGSRSRRKVSRRLTFGRKRGRKRCTRCSARRCDRRRGDQSPTVRHYVGGCSQKLLVTKFRVLYRILSRKIDVIRTKKGGPRFLFSLFCKSSGYFLVPNYVDEWLMFDPKVVHFILWRFLIVRAGRIVLL